MNFKTESQEFSNYSFWLRSPAVFIVSAVLWALAGRQVAAQR